MATPDFNKGGRRYGFGRGNTAGIRNVPIDVLARMDATDMQSLIRDARGQFIERGRVAQALAAAHRDMAVSAGEFMVRAYNTRQRQIGRPQNRKHYFRNAIRDSGNRISTPTGWGVGLPEHYDRSPARRYWRFIEFGGANPMEQVVARGDIVARFWNPYRAFPSAGQFRRHGRLSWQYLSDILPPDPNTTTAAQAINAPGALAGTPSDPSKYVSREYQIIGRRKTIKLYFRRYDNAAKVKSFRPFEGYDFHLLGGERFLAARQPSEIYRQYLGPLGVTVT
jgi:hypothetical protein